MRIPGLTLLQTEPILLALGALMLVWTPLAPAQIYAPSIGFFNGDPPPLLYNQFMVEAANDGPLPGSVVFDSTTNSGLLAATGPFLQYRTVLNDGTFSTFLGEVTATEMASVSTSADYGTLSVDAIAVATSSFSTALFGDFTLTSAGQPIVQFTDTVTVTPTPANPAGTLVPVTFTEAFTRCTFSIEGNSPDTVAELIGTLYVRGSAVSISAIFGQSYQAASGFSTPLPFPSVILTYGNATSVWSTVNLEVGSPYTITGGIFAVGQAASLGDTSEGLSDSTNSIVERATAQLYIDPSGLSYTTAGGAIYPVPPLPSPTLCIQPTTNRGVIVSWPSVYTNYILQQNVVLNTTNWMQTSNTIAVIKGTNQVAIVPATGNMYFRLASP
jgi:hypothetical protein